MGRNLRPKGPLKSPSVKRSNPKGLFSYTQSRATQTVTVQTVGELAEEQNRNRSRNTAPHGEVSSSLLSKINNSLLL